MVGLGNPGRKYEGTRHNLGFDIVKSLAAKNSAVFSYEAKVKGNIARVNHLSVCTILLLPLTYMNLSGESVSATLRYYNILLDNMLIVCDDVDLSVGKIRLREKGSSGGHNGLKSIAAHVKCQEYARLKVGIGKPSPERELHHFVLEKFSSAEREVLDRGVVAAVRTIEAWMQVGSEAAQKVVESFLGEVKHA